MAKRLTWIAFLGTLFLIVGMPAAIAAPGHASSNAHKRSGPTHEHEPKAIDNATRGMNRPGSPGTWKAHGHVPAAVSAPQGYSPSDPDANGNGGLDKPGQTGGFNADRDGNNGCGNDSDREDDNNGWCGLKPRSTPPTPPTPQSKPPAVTPVVIPVRVLGQGPVTRGATLPKTGADVADLLVAGSSLLVAGVGMRRKAKRAR